MFQADLPDSWTDSGCHYKVARYSTARRGWFVFRRFRQTDGYCAL